MAEIDFNGGWYCNGNPVILPHDAMIHEKRDQKSPSGSAGAFFPGGIYVYEKTFDAPEQWRDMDVSFIFEGVYKNSEVAVNGTIIGGCAYGYSRFIVQAEGCLQYGQQNTIRVTAKNDQMPNSRWYSGSGIYRPVWLMVQPKSHISIDGVRVMTLCYNPAKIRVETVYTGIGDVLVAILEDGKVIAEADGENAEITLQNAKLWSAETPNLYQCRVQLSVNGSVIDEAAESFGIRLLEWSNKGFLVNGKETLLRGGCIHHDNGILGAATFAKSEARRVRLLKAAGYNALRIAHNPASVALLDACDRYGLYVMDETWDMWYSHKNKYDYAADFTANYQFDLHSIVDKDFNHPSVIMYSIGNEVSEPSKPKGVELTKEMTKTLHRLDGTRPVTGGFNLMIINSAAKGKGIYKEDGGRNDEGAANIFGKMNSTMFNMITQMVGTGMNKSANSKKADETTTPCLDALDVAGYNYGSGRYAKEGALHPKRVLLGSETFPQDIAKNWAMVKRYPYLIGDFMWTAWDYLGENGLGAWGYTSDAKGFDKPYPWMLADCGALDILGDPTGEVFLAQAAWGLLKKPKIGVRPVNHPHVKPVKMAWRGTNALPGWAWKDCEGNAAVVEVFSDAYTVELLLNGKRIGKQRVKGCKAMFKTKYAAGELTAVAYDESGKETGRETLQSAKGKLSIQAKAEDNEICVGDIVYINVSLVGENGVTERNADTKLTVTVEGGELLAFGSATPRTEENYGDGAFSTYYGRALAVVRGSSVGAIKVTVSGAGLANATAQIGVMK